MKYTFIAPVFRFKIDKVTTKGIRIYKNIKLTNDSTFLNEFVEKNNFREHIGEYHFEEIQNNTYIYIEGDSDDYVEKHKINNQLEFAFFHLRGVQSWLELMWLIKDNGAYVRDGHFYVTPSEHINIGVYEKASLDSITSTSEGEFVPTSFSKEEIISSRALIDDLDINLEEYSHDGMLPTTNPFGKGFTRTSRASHFCTFARRNSSLALKIFYYCTALECLFTTDNVEVSHKIAERAAYLIGKNGQERKHIYKTIKDAYNHRSNLTHGNTIKESNEKLMGFSKFLDSLLREILVNHEDVFASKDLNSYFIDLLFNAER